MGVAAAIASGGTTLAVAQSGTITTGSVLAVNSMVVTHPANMQVGDTMICIIKEYDGRTATFPSGWSVISNTTSQTRPMIAGYKQVVAADVGGSSTWTFASAFTNGATYTCWAVKSGLSTPIFTTKSTTATATAITTTAPSSLVYYVVTSATTAITGITAPGGYSLFNNFTTTVSANTISIYVYVTTQAAAGTTGAVTATITGGANLESHLIAYGRI